jgi:hypothetical protein
MAWQIKHERELALSDFNDAIRLDPNNGLAYNNRAIIWREKNNVDRAIADSPKRSASIRCRDRICPVCLISTSTPIADWPGRPRAISIARKPISITLSASTATTPKPISAAPSYSCQSPTMNARFQTSAP